MEGEDALRKSWELVYHRQLIQRVDGWDKF
jgi:hypothetical protein